jgi:hypothetical protein
MMALVGCAVVLVVLVFGVLVLRALNQGRDVKAGLKIPFATFFFEASDRHKFSPKLLPRDRSKPLKEPDA